LVPSQDPVRPYPSRRTLQRSEAAHCCFEWILSSLSAFGDGDAPFANDLLQKTAAIGAAVLV
jgi:hypothetical protein